MKRLFFTVIVNLLSQWSFLGKLFTKKGRAELEVEDMNEKLKAAILEQNKAKRGLKKKIIREYNSKKTGVSRFIPFKGKSREKIAAEIKTEFGEEMKEVGLTLGKDLSFK